MTLSTAAKTQMLCFGRDLPSLRSHFCKLATWKYDEKVGRDQTTPFCALITVCSNGLLLTAARPPPAVTHHHCLVAQGQAL
eukprot:1094683-Amphidinium_carterae.1